MMGKRRVADLPVKGIGRQGRHLIKIGPAIHQTYLVELHMPNYTLRRKPYK